VIDTSESTLEILDTFVTVPLAGGRGLAGRLWRPAGGGPVPAILDVSPYRVFDVFRPGQERLCRAWAERGYAVLALDDAGSGGSAGRLRDEYLPGEIDDAVAAVDWCAGQAWCSGAVGMSGLSWAGFVALRVAARRPAALKALAIGGVSEDGWRTDIHNLGGASYAARIDWAATMLAFNALPPDPLQFGEGWREEWLARLEADRPWIETWLAHPARDRFWADKAVDLDAADAPDVPLLLYAGLADKYATSVLRIAGRWRGPVRTILGPWEHTAPDLAARGPRVGFQTLAAGWWDRWLKGIDNAALSAPALTAWIGEPDAEGGLETGRWVASPWPLAHPPALALALTAEGRLAPAAADRRDAPPIRLEPAPVAPARLAPDLYEDAPARFDPAGHWSALSDPAPAALDILGAPVLRCRIAADRPGGQIVARLADVAPDGSMVRMSVGALNLALTEPGRGEVEIPLQATAWRLKAGHRLALVLAANGWPTLWPPRAPAPPSLGAVRLEIPLCRAEGPAPNPPPPALPKGPKIEALKWLTPADATPAPIGLADAATLESQSLGHHLAATGTDYLWRSRFALALSEAARQAIAVKTAAIAFQRPGWSVRVETRLEVASSPDAFEIAWSVRARETDEVLFDRAGQARVPRSLV
jgi:hypothetical protein